MIGLKFTNPSFMGKELIDIGSGAIDRAIGNPQGGATVIDLANPANQTGVIDRIEIWFSANATGVKVGTFFGTAPTFTSRDVAIIGSVTAGSKQVFTGLNIAVQAGDYLGIYCTTGDMEYDTSGGVNIYFLAGDQFGAGAQVYTQNAGDAQSVYGTGTT